MACLGNWHMQAGSQILVRAQLLTVQSRAGSLPGSGSPSSLHFCMSRWLFQFPLSAKRFVPSLLQMKPDTCKETAITALEGLTSPLTNVIVVALLADLQQRRISATQNLNLQWMGSHKSPSGFALGSHCYKAEQGLQVNIECNMSVSGACKAELLATSYRPLPNQPQGVKNRLHCVPVVTFESLKSP